MFVWQVEFRLFGSTYKMSMKQFAVHTGLYTQSETESPEFATAWIEGPDDELYAFWTFIALGKGAFYTGEEGAHDRATKIK